MDDKLTKFFLFSLSLSFSLPLLFHFPHSSSLLLTVTPCHCFEPHVLEGDDDCHPPLSLLAAFGRELLYFMGLSNLLEMSALFLPFSLSLSRHVEKEEGRERRKQTEIMK